VPPLMPHYLTPDKIAWFACLHTQAMLAGANREQAVIIARDELAGIAGEVLTIDLYLRLSEAVAGRVARLEGAFGQLADLERRVEKEEEALGEPSP
jgi:hypothetical protein